MNFRSIAATAFTLLAMIVLPSLSAKGEEGRRLEVLFLGDDGHHKPIERYRVLKQALGPKGVNLTFIEDLKQITRERLDAYDALIVYANHEDDVVPAAIKSWVDAGGGLVALHSACGCFHPSPDWFALVGGRFAAHEGREVTPETIDAGHAITKDLPVLTCWDETYVHKDLTNDRHVLQVRKPSNRGETKPEPWTWTREQGKGRVFYTASGHDLRCWNLPAYQELVLRGTVWAAAGRADGWKALKLPELKLTTPELRDRSHPNVPMMPLQEPLSAKDSAKHVQVPAGTKLELFAAEPLVVKPIALDWDLRGRAWVVEALDYPNDIAGNEVRRDRIVILEDRDGDGKADTRTVFFEGLRLATTLCFANGGVIATDGEEIVFLKDENSDDKADTRKVLATGFKIWDSHACTSHFHRGLDNWIYATTGYSGFDIEVAGRKYKSPQGVFRFKPDFSAFEILQNTTNNTWGLGFSEEGDVFGSTANNNPSWVLSIPARYYESAGMKAPRTPRVDTSQTVYPITRDFTQVDQIDCYTAGAGHEFYLDRLPGMPVDGLDALVSEPTCHLVGIGRIRPSGSLFATGFRGNNLYASSDAWSAPVAARTGPDGAVWIADWYNPIVQHNVVFRFYNPARGYDQAHSPYQTGANKPGAGNAYVTPLRDRQHGRIWRVVPEGGARKRETPLDSADPKSLVSALSHPSMQRRLDAQRLLVERGKPDVEGPLAVLVASGESLPAIHAMHALEGLDVLKREGVGREAVVNRLSSKDPLGVRHALQTLGGADAAVAGALPGLLQSKQDPRERLFTLLAVAEAPPSGAIGDALFRLMREEGPKADETLQDAMRIAARRQGAAFLAAALPSAQDSGERSQNELPNGGFEEAAGDLPAGGWKLFQWNPQGSPRVTTAIEAGGREGKALRITSTEPTDTSVGILLKLEPGAGYRFSGSIRTEKLELQGGRGAMLNLHGGAGSAAVKGTTGWTPVSFEFTAPGDGACQLNCVFGAYGKGSGTAWFDDLKLERVKKGGFDLTAETIDAAVFTAQGGTSAIAAALEKAAPGVRRRIEEGVRSRGGEPAPAKLPAHLEGGQALYQKVCIECHQLDGRGVPATFPPLAGSEWVKGDGDTVLRILLGGLMGKVTVAGTEYNSAMPGHFHLQDAELAAVASYVRYQFGGLKEEPVKPERVKELRPGVQARQFAPWTVEDLKKAMQ